MENLNTSSTDMSYIVSWNSYKGLLPVVYNISIWSTSNKVVMSNSTVDPMFHFDSNVYYLLSNTTYFVLVTTCNSAGCSQDCGNTTVHTGGVSECVYTYSLLNCYEMLSLFSS